MTGFFYLGSAEKLQLFKIQILILVFEHLSARKY